MCDKPPSPSPIRGKTWIRLRPRPLWTRSFRRMYSLIFPECITSLMTIGSSFITPQLWANRVHWAVLLVFSNQSHFIGIGVNQNHNLSQGASNRKEFPRAAGFAVPYRKHIITLFNHVFLFLSDAILTVMTLH